MLRRDFLLGAAGLAACTGVTTVSRPAGAAGRFGPLKPDPQGLVELPAGFSYQILQRAGDPMSDGLRAGRLPDGMACFTGADGRWILMRNHEEGRGISPRRDVAFDVLARGGVSRLVIDPSTLEVVSSNLVLTGTMRNCAGGPSPWGWLSCEEAIDPGHGWVFRCDPEATEARRAEPIEGYGRFRHEAVAVDPDTRVAYLTEDEGDSCLYRHVPTRRAVPFEGSLQALAVTGQDRFRTATGMTVGQMLPVRWVNVSDPKATTTRTALQAQRQGAAVFVRGEGCWFDPVRRAVFFTATSGGPGGHGQVFRLDPTAAGGTLTLVAQADDGSLVKPDNVTVAPWGDLVVCEDRLTGDNHLRTVSAEGALHDFGRNVLNGGASEFAGVCFSPDGRVMFVNLQGPGLTLAIRGPFPDV